VVRTAQPKEDRRSSAVVRPPYTWGEVVAMRSSHGIAVADAAGPPTVEAAFLRSMYERWHQDMAGLREVLPIWELFYRLRAEYRHLSQQERVEVLPGLVLTALNDRRGGLSIVPVPASEKRRGDDW
jgi:hypothetical protein